MAHRLKIKSGAVSGLVGHYERSRSSSFDRNNIDASRTSLNYNLAPHDVAAEVRAAMELHSQTAGRAVRSDANVLFDWCITLPQDCPQDRAREFFDACLGFLRDRYGADNIMGGYVHMDETTPHMHAPILPMIDGKLQASKMIGLRDLQSFHGDLGDYVDRRLGMHVSIELDEDKAIDKALSSVPQKDLDAVREAIERDIEDEQRRLECLQREAAQVERDVGQIEIEIASAEAAPARQETLGESIKRAKGIEQGNEKLRERIDQIRERIGEVRGMVDKLRNDVVERVERCIVRAKNLPVGRVSRRDHFEASLDRAEKASRSVSPTEAARRAGASARVRNSVNRGNNNRGMSR